MFLRDDWGCLIFNLTCLRKLQVRPVVISFYTPIQSYLTFAILFQYLFKNSKSWFAEEYRKSEVDKVKIL